MCEHVEYQLVIHKPRTQQNTSGPKCADRLLTFCCPAGGISTTSIFLLEPIQHTQTWFN